MNINRLKKWLKNSLGDRWSLIVVILSAALIELVCILQFWYAREGIRNEVRQRAESELKMKGLEIKNIMTAVEVAGSATLSVLAGCVGLVG